MKDKRIVRKRSSRDIGENDIASLDSRIRVDKRMLPSELVTGAVTLWKFAGNIVHLHMKRFCYKMMQIDRKRASY